MRRNRLTRYTATAILAALMASCSTPREQITASPEPNVLVPDEHNEATLVTEITIPPRYLSTRSRVAIVPQLVAGGDVLKEYEPIVLDGKIHAKKNRRRQRLSGYRDPYARTARTVSGGKGVKIDYQQIITLPEGVQGAEVVGMVTKDGCGVCSDHGRFDIATVSSTGSLMSLDDLQLEWEDPAFEVVAKEYEGSGEARLQFIVNKWDIELPLANNRQELDKMLHALRPIVTDSLVTLKWMSIKGSASPEGPYDNNIRLAGNRAQSARNWLADHLSLPKDMRGRIMVGSAPEGWESVVRNMHEAGDPDSIMVLDIIRRYPAFNDDLAEAEIRRLPIWDRIKDRYLAKDRKVLYEYSWKVRSFNTDEEMARMYQSRPDALNEQEFLRVASIAENPTLRKKIYSDMLRYHPGNAIAVSNLAILMIEEGDLTGAKELLDRQFRLSAPMRNSLGVIDAEEGELSRAATLFKESDTPESRHNLGVVYAMQGRPALAYESLQGEESLSGAIAALGVGKDRQAWDTLADLRNETPRAEYVRAIAAARLGKYADALRYLRSAAADPALRKRAVTEPDFKRLRNDVEFLQIVNQ